MGIGTSQTQKLNTMPRGINTLESWMMVNGKDGDTFYTHKKDKDITAIASYYKRKVNTERLILVSNSKDKPEANAVTKVTLLTTKNN